jgi:hypothetical protein
MTQCVCCICRFNLSGFNLKLPPNTPRTERNLLTMPGDRQQLHTLYDDRLACKAYSANTTALSNTAVLREIIKR